jgi:hypothetical protein
MRLTILARGRRPALIWIGAPVLLVVSGLNLLFWLIVMLDQLTGSGGQGFSTVAAVEVRGLDQHLAVTPVVFLLFGTLGLLGYGLLRQRTWARRIGVLYWFGAGVLLGLLQVGAGLGRAALVVPVIFGAVASLVAWWYFYVKTGVAAYYAGL